MTSTCPAGHASAADDYCDVCGLPIGDPPAAPPAVEIAQPSVVEEAVGAPQAGNAPSGASRDPAPETAAGTATCPNCQAVNPPNALFCEACGYDFTTGSLPRPLVTPASTGVSAGSTSEEGGSTGSTSQEGVAPAIGPGWVVEVWIDPDWYAAQQSDDPLPSAGVPSVVPLRARSLLIGRASQSRGISPDLDLSSDSGISRRHCQLTTDGSRWWVEDLGSSNGTYVADAVGPLPTVPLVQGQKRELDGDDRIYLGAWTRLFVRRAEPGEI